MTCRAAVENLVECARRRTGPDPGVRAHLLSCRSCMERWESERLLTAHLRRLSARADGLRSSEWSRQDVRRHFDTVRVRRLPVRAGAWAVAATLLLSAGLIWNSGALHRAGTLPPAGAEVSEEAEPAVEGSAEEGFMAVPFAPPLAEGEMVRVVHRDLQPVELASLGVDVDPAWLAAMQSGSGGGIQAGLPADVLVGADGFPRAVRLSDEPRNEGF